MIALLKSINTFMNITIIYSYKPFEKSDDDVFIYDLVDLLKVKHKIELLKVPYTATNKSEVLLQTMAFLGIKLDNTHCLITLNSPSCYIEHIQHIALFNKTPTFILKEELNKISYCIATKNIEIKKLFDKDIEYIESDDVLKEVKKIIDKLDK